MKYNHVMVLIAAVVGIVSKECAAQDWAPLPFRFNSNEASIFVEPTENVMYLSGLFDSVNGVKARTVRWDGKAASYLDMPADDVVHYKGRLYFNTQGIVSRYDTTTWTQLNNNFCWWGPFHRAGDRYLLNLFRTDSVSFQESTSMGVWDGTTLKDTLGLDTLWKGRLWSFESLAWYKGELYMGGLMYPDDHPQINLIARFDGKSWKDVAGGIQAGRLAHINQMLVWGDDLYVAGQFLEKAGAQGNCIARWDGSSWHRLGDGVYMNNGDEADIQKMVVFNNELYVAGFFDRADGIETKGVAKWDGQKWCTVTDQFDDWFVQDVAVYKGSLYVGGGWYSINGDSSFNHLAKYVGTGFSNCSTPLSVGNPVSAFGAVTTYPNPANDRLFIRTDSVESISIFDITGRQLINQKYDHCGIDVSKLVCGIYTLKIQRQGMYKTIKFYKQ